MKNTAKVVVIGGGVVGLSLAYGLAKAAERVLILDEGEDAYRSALLNLGLVWVHGKRLSFATYALLPTQYLSGSPALCKYVLGCHGRPGFGSAASLPGR